MTDMPPRAGVPQVVAPGLRRILAPNPSPMTHWGTNTFILGEDELAVIDPGPEDDAHLQAILSAVGPARVAQVIVTHSHLDHSPLAARLAQDVGAPVLAFGDSFAGKSKAMQRLENAGLAGGGEGIDHSFKPDRLLTDGEVLTSKDWTLTALHTPGHMGNHIALFWEDAIFTGDLIMGWASTMVSPPDGDLSDFLASCARLKSLTPKVLYPAHGDPVTQPIERIDWLVDHRNARTTEILDHLAKGAMRIDALTKAIYVDAPAGLLAAASRNVFAHLIDLHEKGIVSADPELHQDAVFTRTA